MILASSHHNVEMTVIKLLKRLNLRIPKKKIFDEFGLHPDYPSLLAISDVLSNFKIANKAFKASHLAIADIPTPFIAHTLFNEGEFSVIENVDDKYVYYNKLKVPLKEFNEKFTGYVLLVDEKNTIYERNNYKNDFLQELIEDSRFLITIAGFFMVFLLSAILISNFFTGISWSITLITLLKLIGLSCSVLLLIQSIDSSNPFINRLCGTGEKTDCNAILSSEAAYLLTGLSWSEVGFFYFSGSWLALLFSGGSVQILQILSFMNIIALPYTFYSIYYQALKAKQWCVFCCTIQALLWLEFVPLFLSLRQGITWPNYKDLGVVAVSFLVPIILWIFLKPFFLLANQVKPLKDQIQAFKFNSIVFQRFLQEQPYNIPPDKECSIILGNENAENIITVVSNPYCKPCARTHEKIMRLLSSTDNIQVRLIFVATSKDIDNLKDASTQILAIASLKNKIQVDEALTEWYKSKSNDAWMKKYKVDLNEGILDKRKKQLAWCKVAGIKDTPTITLNGFRLPSNYDVLDLKYLVA